VPVICWTVNFGCSLNDNEFLYFLAPQQIAQYWMGLEKVCAGEWPVDLWHLFAFEVIKCIQEQSRHPDRRVMWLKKLYLQLYGEQERELAGGGIGSAGTAFKSNKVFFSQI
jgi:hypothetical protein